MDQPIEKVLEKAYNQENKNRNRILFIAVVIVIIIGFCIMSLIYGKIQIDTLNNIRSDGITVSTYLENGTKNECQQLKSLSYIKEIGLKKNVAKLIQNQQPYCSCVVLDKSAYEEMIVPAIGDIHGSYPQTSDEIMLSLKTLEYLGIEKPKIGMKISLEFYWNDIFCTTLTGEQEFVLSGYYKDFKNDMPGSQEAYISDKRLKECSIKQFPCQILINTKTKYLGGNKTENILYRDLILRSGQQIISMDSPEYRAIEGMVGGCGIAVLFLIIIMLVLFLFIYNVIYISMDKDIRQYGLLKILGVQNEKIKKIIYSQILKVCGKGSLVGVFGGSVIVGIVFPQIINRIYSDVSGGKVRVFYGPFLLIICISVWLIVFGTMNLSLKRILQLNPIQTVKYENIEVSFVNEKKIYKKKRNKEWNIDPIFRIAWSNIIRSKKKIVLTIVSLVLGCEIALISATVINGTDLMNKLLENPDFCISITQNACIAMIENSQETAKKVFFDDATIFQMVDSVGVDMDWVEKIEGFIPIIDKEGGKSLRILQSQTDPMIIIQKMDEAELKQLVKYIRKREIDADLDTFMENNGVLILHSNLLSEVSKEEAVDNIGKTIGIYDLVPVGTDMSDYIPVELINCAYLDITDKSFPELELAWNGENTICMVVSEKTFNNLESYLTKQTFQVSFCVEENRENGTKNIVKQWIKEKNIEFQEKNSIGRLDLLSLKCNSENIVKAQNYILTTRLIMWTVSILLLFVGIMNYLNIMLTDIITRSREFVIMRNIGLTKKQLRRMLTLEGMFYYSAVVVLLVTVGNAMLYLLCKYIQTKLTYFVFKYPEGMFVGLMMTLIFICISIPHIIYRQQRQQVSSISSFN